MQSCDSETESVMSLFDYECAITSMAITIYHDLFTTANERLVDVRATRTDGSYRLCSDVGGGI